MLIFVLTSRDVICYEKNCRLELKKNGNRRGTTNSVWFVLKDRSSDWNCNCIFVNWYTRKDSYRCYDCFFEKRTTHYINTSVGLKLANPVTEDDNVNISLWLLQINTGISLVLEWSVVMVLWRLLTFWSFFWDFYWHDHLVPIEWHNISARYIRPKTFQEVKSLIVFTLKKCDETVSDYLATHKNCMVFKDGQCSIRLPWKHNHPMLPNNYNIALEKNNSEYNPVTTTRYKHVTELRHDYLRTRKSRLYRK